MENNNVKGQNNFKGGNRGFQRKERTGVLQPSGYNYRVHVSQINEFLMTFFEEQGIQGIYGPYVEIEKEGRLDNNMRVAAYLMMEKNSPDIITNKTINTNNALPQHAQRMGGGKSRPSAKLSDALVQIGQFEMNGDKPRFTCGAVAVNDGKKIVFYLDEFKVLGLMAGVSFADYDVSILSAKQINHGEDGIINFSVYKKTKKFGNKAAQMRAVAKKLKANRR